MNSTLTGPIEGMIPVPAAKALRGITSRERSITAIRKTEVLEVGRIMV